jgi:hypothetical protein
MCKIFQKIDENVLRFVTWVTFFGIVSAAMSGAAAYIIPITKYGWGAVVFAGVGAACGVTLVGSVALASWRYFKPIPDRVESDRRALIAQARDFVSRTVRQNPDDIYFQNQLESDPVFFILRPHLSGHFHGALIGRVVSYPSRPGATMPQTAYLFIREIERLEKEWNLT